MTTQRKPWLGRYNGSRKEWSLCYGQARANFKNGLELSHSLSGLNWKAGLIVYFDREQPDPLSIPAKCRLVADRIVDEVIADERNIAQSLNKHQTNS